MEQFGWIVVSIEWVYIAGCAGVLLGNAGLIGLPDLLTTRSTHKLWMLWPPYRRRWRSYEAWCDAHAEQITEFARNIAQLGVPASSIRF